MSLSIELPFDNIEDMNLISQELNGFKDSTGRNIVKGFLGFNSTFYSSKKVFQRNVVLNEQQTKEDRFAMLMLDSSQFKVIYYFQKNVKQTTMEQAIVDKNKVMVESKLVDLLSGKRTLQGKIILK